MMPETTRRLGAGVEKRQVVFGHQGKTTVVGPVSFHVVFPIICWDACRFSSNVIFPIFFFPYFRVIFSIFFFVISKVVQ